MPAAEEHPDDQAQMEQHRLLMNGARSMSEEDRVLSGVCFRWGRGGAHGGGRAGDYWVVVLVAQLQRLSDLAA